MNRRDILKVVGAATALPLLSSAASALDKVALRRAQAVLAAAEGFGRGGGYDRSWKSSGSPAAVVHRGETILGASESGTYCCGWTFAVAAKALQEAGKLKGKSVAELRRIQKVWFGATGDGEEAERQCALAVEDLGVGREVKSSEATAGDFAQLWRKGSKPSGHSVLFLGWIEVGDERVGLSYQSSQGSTNGIGYSVEFFHGAKAGQGRVDPDRLYFARLDL